MLRALLLASALIGGALISGFDMAARAQDAPPGDATARQALYLSTGCFYCHGRAGQGGAYNRPAPSLAKTDRALPWLQEAAAQSVGRHAGLCRGGDERKDSQTSTRSCRCCRAGAT